MSHFSAVLRWIGRALLALSALVSVAALVAWPTTQRAAIEAGARTWWGDVSSFVHGGRLAVGANVDAGPARWAFTAYVIPSPTAQWLGEQVAIRTTPWRMCGVYRWGGARAIVLPLPAWAAMFGVPPAVWCWRWRRRARMRNAGAFPMDASEVDRPYTDATTGTGGG